MPFYEYMCTVCGTEKTILQKISDAPAVDCPACGQPGLTKQISAAGFRLKGGGWYETDFNSGNKKNLAGEGSSGGESKPAENPIEKSADKAGEKSGEKTGEKTAEKSSDKKPEKNADKPTSDAGAAGKTPVKPAPAAKSPPPSPPAK